MNLHMSEEYSILPVLVFYKVIIIPKLSKNYEEDVANWFISNGYIVERNNPKKKGTGIPDFTIIKSDIVDFCEVKIDLNFGLTQIIYAYEYFTNTGKYVLLAYPKKLEIYHCPVCNKKVFGVYSLLSCTHKLPPRHL